MVTRFELASISALNQHIQYTQIFYFGEYISSNSIFHASFTNALPIHFAVSMKCISEQLLVYSGYLYSTSKLLSNHKKSVSPGSGPK